MVNNLGNKITIAKNLKYYMDLFNIDRSQLSDEIGVPYTTLTDWLKAKTYPRIDKIELLARRFNITKAELVEDHLNTEELQASQDSDFVELYRLYKDLRPEQKKIVDSVAKGFSLPKEALPDDDDLK